MWFKLALRLFKRELGRGDLTIIAAAIVLAVLSVFALSSISGRIQDSILQKSASFIAADKVLGTAQDIPTDFFAQAPLDGVSADRHLQFSSMVFFNDELQMATVKSVTETYPLRGEVILADIPYGEQYRTKGAPGVGEVWASQRLLDILKMEIGDLVEVGVAPLKVTKVLIEEPDGSFNPFSSYAKIIMNDKDVGKTEIIQPGSRITYRYLFASDDKEAIDALTEWIKPQLTESQLWYGVRDRADFVTESLQRSERFLLLAGLLGIILAAVAIAVAAQRYCQRHYDPVAIFKTLGASAEQIKKIYIAHLVFLTLMSVVIGVVIGYGVQDVIFEMIKEYLPKPLPALGIKPWIMAILTGIICSLMFSLYPLLQLFDIPPLRVLRRNAGDDKPNDWRYLTISSLTVFLLMLAFSQSFKLTGILFVVGVVLVLVLMGLSRLFINAGRAVGMRPSNPFNLAMASIKRRVKANSVQLITFTLAIHLLLALFMLKDDMINEWRAQLPADAPDHFLVNVSKTELDAVNQTLDELEIKSEGLYPVVLGRLVEINGERLIDFVSKEDKDESDGGGREGVGRELSLTWRDTLPMGNTVVEGKWLTADAKNEVSVSKSVAERVDIKLGDDLVFLIGGEESKVKVTSIRDVDWNTLQPNFFMIFSPDVLADFPATHITSFFVPKDKKQALNRFLRDYPTIVVVEVGNILKRVQENIDQVSVAIEFVLLIVIIAGVLVLIAQVQASMEERQQEIVILRTLGAKGSLIRYAVALEFLMMGVIAGLMATIATEVLLAALQYFAFSMPIRIHWDIWWMGPVIGGCFVATVGLMATAKLLTKNTSQMLRSVNL